MRLAGNWVKAYSCTTTHNQGTETVVIRVRRLWSRLIYRREVIAAFFAPVSPILDRNMLLLQPVCMT